MVATHPHAAAVLAGPSGPQVGAFFDLDGTVIDGHAFAGLEQRRLRDRLTGRSELAELVAASPSELDEDEFTRLAQHVVADWTGRDADELLELGRRQLVRRTGGLLFPAAWAVVQAHLGMGHTVVIASAATRFQVEPFAEELGVDHVLCTKVEAHAGVLTGGLDGPPLWGTRKTVAVRAFAEAHDLDLARCHAYADGGEDAALLAAVGHPHAVNPQPGLAERARREGWDVITFEGRGRSTPRRVARTAAMLAGMAVGSTIGAGLGVLNRDHRQGVDLATSLFGDLALGAAGVEVDVRGKEHLWSHRPAVFLFNHQSGLDMPLVMKLLRERFTGVAKAELAHAPGLGPFLRWADVAFVDRTNTSRAREALTPVVDRLQSGISVVIAPEGTRSATPRLGPFKKGAFHMAMQAGVPIVPIVIRNSGELAWRNSVLVDRGTIDVAVLPPVPVDDWSVATLDDHVAEVRQLFLDALRDWPEDDAAPDLA